MANSIQHSNPRVDFLLQQFDRGRQRLLRSMLQKLWMRKLYSEYLYRTLTSQLLWACLIMPIAILRPDLLLIFGPLVFGYPHMMASYRYLLHRNIETEKYRPQLFKIFCGFTFLILIIYNTKFLFLKMSFNVWPLLIAMLVLSLAYYLGVLNRKQDLAFGLLSGLGLAVFAWHEPLLYVGGILMLHNFMAYFHWVMSCKKKSHFRLAVLSTFVFFLIHLVVIYGAIDPLLNASLLEQWRLENTAWFLASWSADPLVWYRWLVLYTFGLSMHYFVWLRALPEAELKSKAPLSFRLSWQEWQKDIGPITLKIILISALIGFGLWIFQYNLGKTIYFQIALLHAALEVVFLPSKFSSSHKFMTILSKT